MKPIPQARVVACIILAIALPTACATDPTAPTAGAHLSASLSRITDGIRASSDTPAVSAAVMRKGRLLWAGGSGVADRDLGTPATAATVYPIGSVTKLLTAGLLVKLVSDGVVGLDEPVRNLVPEFPHEGVTLGMLAAHRAGIRHYQGREFFNQDHFDALADVLPRFIDDPLLAVPGAAYNYSSYGYTLLGVALERAAGAPFTELVQRFVLEPAQLTSIHPEGSPPDPRAAKGYDRFDDEIVESPAHDSSDRWPAAGYVADAPALARFGMQSITGLFSPGEQRLLFTPRRRGATAETTGVGLGWRIDLDPAGRRFVHHEGSGLGSRSVLVVYPDEKLVVSLEGNLGRAPFGDADARFIADVARCGGGSAIPSDLLGSYTYEIRRPPAEDPLSGELHLEPQGRGRFRPTGEDEQPIEWSAKCGDRLMILASTGGGGAELFWLSDELAAGELRGHTWRGADDLRVRRASSPG